MKPVLWALPLILASHASGAGCDSIAGDWQWFTGGVASFTAQNAIIYDGKPAGKWSCADAARNVATLRWNTGFVDTVTISGDRISGKNQQGIAISGTRKQARAATRSPAAGERVSVTPNPSASDRVSVAANPALQRCIGVGSSQSPPHKIGPSPATMQYCRQLPAWDTYEQAGDRFKAGDVAGAARLARTAAEAGNPLAQVRLAMLYEKGQGVPKSGKDAFAWYLRAAQAGEPAAQSELGGYYEEGDGVPETWTLAAQWYARSAAQGWVKGEFALGRAYEFGIGVPQSRQDAIAWFQKAGAQGDAQGAYFAKWLKDPTNNIGFRNNAEHDLVIGGKLRFGLSSDDPAGITFRTSGQRTAWLQGLRNRVDSSEAHTMWQMRKNDYDKCRQGGGDNCHAPGPEPGRQ